MHQVLCVLKGSACQMALITANHVYLYYFAQKPVGMTRS